MAVSQFSNARLSQVVKHGVKHQGSKIQGLCEAQHKTGAGNKAGARNKLDSGVRNIADEGNKVGLGNNSVATIWLSPANDPKSSHDYKRQAEASECSGRRLVLA